MANKFEVTLADGKVIKFGSKNHIYTHAFTVKVTDRITGEIVKAYMWQRCHSLANAQKAVASNQKHMGLRGNGLLYTAEITEIRQVK